MCLHIEIYVSLSICLCLLLCQRTDCPTDPLLTDRQPAQQRLIESLTEQSVRDNQQDWCQYRQGLADLPKPRSGRVGPLAKKH